MNPLDQLGEWSEQLFAFIRTRVSSEEDSWDIMQDVFLTFISRWNLGDTFESALAWLYRVTRNRIIDLYRGRSFREESLEELLSFGSAGTDGEIPDPDSATPPEVYERAELGRRLQAALEELPSEQREVFLLTELQGMKYAEIAEMTGVPLNTLLSRKHYAVRKLEEKVPEVLQIMERQGRCTR